MMKQSKVVHKRDLRLRNNAGMDFPLCQAGAAILDSTKGHWCTDPARVVTCKHCLRIMARTR